MKRVVTGAVITSIGLGIARWLKSRRTPGMIHHDPKAPYRWQWVTINRPPEEVAPDGRLPEPLARLGDAIEIQKRKAPGDKGTELGARLRQRTSTAGAGGMVRRISGDDPSQEVRRALREAKSLIEIGEVVRVEDSMTMREPTPIGKLPDMATQRAGGEGRQ
ncbi:hypothetical protein ACSDR0_41210 [Streptosporangium sp. G11]|uniref:hypothetical protein n=1 Tax=Streptosporangium sp. G11 TaxID=3436926 RepID=UPI003EB75B8A